MVVILVAVEDREPLFSILAVAFAVVVLWWLLGKIRMVMRLKQEKMEAERLHLQSQVNPHFFFNTLNNLYGLIEQDPARARNLVLRLSDMMRYSIYDGQKTWVPIEKEVHFLRNYVQLHRSRYHRSTDIRFECRIQEEGLELLPLLFIILLENAFKHGVESLREGAYVHMDLEADAERITFRIENNLDPEGSSFEDDPGVGLTNLKKRLELFYPGRHILTTRAMGDRYEAMLEVPPR